MVELSIILVNFNTISDTINCLRSILSSNINIEYEVIVVDNNSINRSEVFTKVKKTFSATRIIFNNKNVGFAAANNQGIKCASGNVILLLNPDIVVHRDAIMNMYSFLIKHENIGLVGPLTIDRDGNVDYYCGRSFPNLFTEFLHHSGLSKWFPHNRFFGQYLMTYWDHKSTKQVDAIQGSGMMVKKEDIEIIGLLDEDFFLYGEDIDWCYRFRKASRINYLCADAVVIHGRHVSTKGKEHLAYIIGCTSMHKFFAKHHGFFTGILYRIEMFHIFAAKFLAGLLIRQKKLKIFGLHILWSLGMLKYVCDSNGNPSLKTSGHIII